MLDVGASAVRLLVAEITPGQPPVILEEASRAVLLGKDAFTGGRLGAGTIEATLRALDGFRRIMDSYGVVRYRAVATSAVREAINRDTFLDRVRLRTGLNVEVIDGSEENRLTYTAVREALREHEALVAGDALLVEVGGGSADLSFLRRGEPVHSGTYALGAVRMRQSLAAWHGSHEQRVRLFRRTVQNIVLDIRREIPLREARYFLALGGDARFVADQLLGEAADAPARLAVPRALPGLLRGDGGPGRRAARGALPPAPHGARDARPRPPRLPRAAARDPGRERPGAGGDAARRAAARHGARGPGPGHRGLLASGAGLGRGAGGEVPVRRGARPARGELSACGSSTTSGASTAWAVRDRLLLEVAALLHDVGIFVSLRGHHKHAQYILSVSEIFGLSRDDMAIISNVARYHRRANPNKSHLPYMALDSDARVRVNKLGAILRVANALDADHLQKVRDVRVLREQDEWVLEVDGGGDLTLERLAAVARADMLVEVFGRKVAFREAAGKALA